MSVPIASSMSGNSVIIVCTRNVYTIKTLGLLGGKRSAERL